MHARALHNAVALFVLGMAALIANATNDEPAHKWRVVLNHTADNSGTLVLRIAVPGQEPQDVETKIPAGTHENHAARILCDSLKASLDEKAYHVETDDGEDVLIKARGHTPKFMVSLVSSSISGLGIRVKHD